MALKRVVLLAVLLLLVLSPPLTAQQPYRVAVLPFTVHSATDLSYLRDGIWDIISTRIIVEGTIEVVQKPLVRRFLSDLRGTEITEREARWLGMRVGADYVVYGSITQVGDFISLDAKAVNVAGTRPTTSSFAQHRGIDEVMPKIDTFAQDIVSRILGRRASYERRGPGQLRQSLMFQALGYTKMQTFPTRILKGVDVGDLDGDGNNEIVVMDPHKLWVYRDEEKALRLKADFTEAISNNFLTVDLLDVNGDKRDDICVTNVIDDNLQSFILTYENGSFRYLAQQLNWYLRVKPIPGKGEVLLAQRMGSRSDFFGPIHLVRWKGGKAKLGKKVKLPRSVEWIYEFTHGHFTAPEAQELLMLDEVGTARVMDEKGTVSWKSKTDLGGSDNFIHREGVWADRDGQGAPEPRRIYLPLRLVVKDLDGDGVDEVVAAVNTFHASALENVKVYDKGYITGRTWDGMSLTSVWRTQDIPGYVADFQVEDLDNDGRDELAAVSVTAHFLKKEARGILSVYELYE